MCARPSCTPWATPPGPTPRWVLGALRRRRRRRRRICLSSPAPPLPPGGRLDLAHHRGHPDAAGGAAGGGTRLAWSRPSTGGARGCPLLCPAAGRATLPRAALHPCPPPAQQKPFKYVCHVNLTQRCGAGMHAASCQRWTPKTDGGCCRHKRGGACWHWHPALGVALQSWCCAGPSACGCCKLHCPPPRGTARRPAQRALGVPDGAVPGHGVLVRHLRRRSAAGQRGVVRRHGCVARDCSGCLPAAGAAGNAGGCAAWHGCKLGEPHMHEGWERHRQARVLLLPCNLRPAAAAADPRSGAAAVYCCPYMLQ